MQTTFEQIRETAKDVYSNARYGSEALEGSLSRYYILGIECPDIAHLIFRDEFKKSEQRYKKNFSKLGETMKIFLKRTAAAPINLMFANRSDSVKPHLRAFTDKWKEKYDESHAARRFIVEKDWVVWDKVKKTNFIQDFFKRISFKRFMKQNGLNRDFIKFRGV